MPELPEVEHLRRSLESFLTGRRVQAARLHRLDICESFRVDRRGTLAPARTLPTDLLEGLTIASLHRHGKQLAIIAQQGPVLLVHLGMSGRLTHAAGPPPKPALHVHASWVLQGHVPENGRCGKKEWPAHKVASLTIRYPLSHLLFTDPRRFGGLWTYPSLAILCEHRWSYLGPDALTITSLELAQRLAHTDRSIKAALLDQAVLAGIGNIYADEALFEAHIKPTTHARKLDPVRVATLVAAIRLVLGRAIDTGGSTIRNYVDGSGKPGRAQAGHAVYGRAGQACVRCASQLSIASIAQRTTVWCPKCQT